MPRKLIRKYLPTQDAVRANRYLRWLGTALHHPNLWLLHRRTVAGGVAAGMFCGLIPGPFQMLSAAACAVAFRVNLPVAMIVTLYTNPLTIVPLYYLAYKLGALATGAAGRAPPADPAIFALPVSQWIPAIIDWMVAMGRPFVVGLVLLAALLAIAGYVLVMVGWRIHVALAWRRRQHVRAGAR
ncbi:MAG TPA: DUF2062 domain-containing protein [Burkholderiales bacterium]|nr:DUF2062 domain-containing protein [Burkholderiales bacterium]